ncbi:acetyltransferase, ribosomal protein N-acetylase [Desulfocapsa sulfexigens DSM 10523]|uniref:Acetyltransferase, ribosomal protein N-acetylase n=1 Tax=Desulfocapsa sulfexigens (strain DSM 10523 / SB164P1) TaxID=1167006 RepID=M1PE94_DESSD|nr:acetyltransferase, ribosomal protein N-acetylase [Desulfocapsa sulfexigens DSM 10523]
METTLLFPKLSTDRLILNELVKEDSEVLYRHFSNKDVIKYYDLEAFSSIDQASTLIQLFKKRFDEALGIRWAIRLKDNGDFIGTCGFNSWNSKMRSSVVGYDISKDFWGNGYATEALRETIKIAFSGGLPCGELNRIQGDTVPGNGASEAVLKKLGFKEEGLLRESGYWKVRFHDLKCFGLIRSDY